MSTQNIETYSLSWQKLLTDLINQDRPALASTVAASS